ncbi:hypothetical protein C8J57DRAFT_1193645 [Mycena rebaudengoi]|nr:hypothetical protein C8J57DRAFT_1193645 [Mycena rebaudengoi]
MGDLDLRTEIYLDRNSVVRRREKQASARRMYSARIPSVDSKMTVAVYQGNNAEEEWREDIQRYLWLRHPNFVQIYGTAGSSGIHAAVFYDDLVPVKKIFEKHRDSQLATVYLWNQLMMDFTNASHYYWALGSSGTAPLYLPACTMWIRRSTGRLCIDIVASYDDLFIHHSYTGLLSHSGDRPSSLLEPPPAHSQIIEGISMEQYHEVCNRYLAQSYSPWSVSPNASIRLGSVVYMPSSCEIVHLPDSMFTGRHWVPDEYGNQVLVLMSSWTRLESSWTRVILSDDNRDREFTCSFDGMTQNGDAWLALANHIFHCAKIQSNYRDYGLINSVQYTLRLADKNDIPHGYLFLCPLQDLQGNSPSEFQYPACPAYWSLDPSGAQRLGSEEAERLGFPSFTLDMTVDSRSWDDLVYAGIREFHQAKGFDPYSQDVAREYGYPLYEVRGKTDILSLISTLISVNITQFMRPRSPARCRPVTAKCRAAHFAK